MGQLAQKVTYSTWDERSKIEGAANEFFLENRANGSKRSRNDLSGHQALKIYKSEH